MPGVTPPFMIFRQSGQGNAAGQQSTVFPEQLQIFCAWQEKTPLNQTGSEWMQYIQHSGHDYIIFYYPYDYQSRFNTYFRKINFKVFVYTSLYFI